jgi:MOSC domain-containing protein YiiM
MVGGVIIALQIAPAKGAPMAAADFVDAVPEKGLRGDRYFGQLRDKRCAAVTLIESEALAALAAEYGIHLPFRDTRRNLLTRGLSLNELVEQEFLVGEVRCRGTALCAPCWHIAQSQPGVLQGLLHRGGLRAEVLTEGTITVGSVVTRSSLVQLDAGSSRRSLENPH